MKSITKKIIKLFIMALTALFAVAMFASCGDKPQNSDTEKPDMPDSSVVQSSSDVSDSSEISESSDIPVAVTYTVTVAVNEQDFGTVDKNKIENVAENTEINAHGNLLTVGETVITATPAESTAQYTYAFEGWEAAETVTGDITVTANFKRSVNEYTVNVVSNNAEYGTVSASSVIVPYGTAITANGTAITIGETTVTATISEPTAQYTYAFANWEAAETVTGNITVTAIFSGTVNKYAVSFNTDGGSDIADISFDYGTSAETVLASVAKPVKANCAFVKWQNNGEDFTGSVTGAITLDAVWGAIGYEYALEYTGFDGGWFNPTLTGIDFGIENANKTIDFSMKVCGTADPDKTSEMLGFVKTDKSWLGMGIERAKISTMESWSTITGTWKLDPSGRMLTSAADYSGNCEKFSIYIKDAVVTFVYDYDYKLDFSYALSGGGGWFNPNFTGIDFGAEYAHKTVVFSMKVCGTANPDKTSEMLGFVKTDKSWIGMVIGRAKISTMDSWSTITGSWALDASGKMLTSACDYSGGYENYSIYIKDITVLKAYSADEASALNVLTTASSWSSHYHGGGVYLFTKLSINSFQTIPVAGFSGKYGFNLTKSAISSILDAGFATMSFKVTLSQLNAYSVPTYMCVYPDKDGVMGWQLTTPDADAEYYGGGYYVSGRTVKVNLDVLNNNVTGGLNFVFQDTTEWGNIASPCYVTFSDFEFEPIEIPWNDSLKLKLATTTGDFSGRSGYLADDKARLDALHAAGFKYVDLSMYSFTADCDYMQSDWANKIAELKAYAESLGLVFVQAHSQGGNALTDEQSEYDALVAYTLRQIEICGELGIENIVVHAGWRAGYTKEQWFAANKAFFDTLLVKAAECGVNVLCENSTAVNMGAMYYINTGADMREFIKYVNHPNFHGCWDTGHGNCEGDQYGDIVALGDEMFAIHFNDNMGNGDTHIIPYYGTLNCDRVMRALNRIGFSGYFTFECDGSARINGNWHGPEGLETLSSADPSSLTREQQEKLLYEIGEYILRYYDMYADQ